MATGYVSQLYAGEKIINDENCLAQLMPVQDGHRRFFGRKPEPKKFKYDSQSSIKTFGDLGIDIIPMDEWDDRIQEMETNKTRISDLLLQNEIPSLDQDGTNYCWCNAITGAVQVIRAQQNQKFVPLSPASVAGPLTNYRNEGGWGAMALDGAVKLGYVATTLWPANAISSQYYSSTRDNAALHKVLEFWKGDSGDFNALMTMLFLRIPTGIGLNWWSHEVMACDPVALGNKQYGVRFRNSWGDSYGSKGFNTLTKQKATPDDQCAPLSAIASNN